MVSAMSAQEHVQFEELLLAETDQGVQIDAKRQACKR